MTVGELVKILDGVEADRVVVVPDGAGSVEPIAAVVDVLDADPIPGVVNEAGVALLTGEQYEDLTAGDE